MTFKVKMILWGLGLVLLISYSAWYMINYLKLERQTVLSIVSQEFDCPKEKIELGSSHQNNDGPSEIPVKGCGKEGLVLCYDDTHKYGMWGQYFAFDLNCRMESK